MVEKALLTKYYVASCCGRIPNQEGSVTMAKLFVAIPCELDSDSARNDIALELMADVVSHTPHMGIAFALGTAWVEIDLVSEANFFEQQVAAQKLSISQKEELRNGTSEEGNSLH